MSRLNTLWTVRQAVVVSLGGEPFKSNPEVWGVYMDGLSRGNALLSLIGLLDSQRIATKQVNWGKYPFFYIVELAGPGTLKQRLAFAKALKNASIQGPYCSDEEATAARRLLSRATIVDHDKRGRVQFLAVEVINPVKQRALLHYVAGLDFCNKAILKDGRLRLELNVSDADLSSTLRVIATMLQMRFDPNDPMTKGILGEPLI